MRMAAAVVLCFLMVSAMSCEAVERTKTIPVTVVHCPTPTQAIIYDNRPEFGVNVSSPNTRSLDMIQQLGVRLVRLTLHWNRMETTDKAGLYDGKYLSEWDALVDECRRRGIYLVVVVKGDPPGISFENRREGFLRYARFVGDMAARYPSVVFWELFDQIDSNSTCLFGAGDGVPIRERGANYARMLQAAYPAIKAANPAAWIVCGGANNADDLLHGIYQAGGRQFFDIMNIHTTEGSPHSSFAEHGRRIRGVMAEYGDGSNPLWNTSFCTDMGNSPDSDAADGDYESEQLDGYRNCVEMNRQSGLYQKYFACTFRQSADGDDRDLGIVQGDLSPGPIYQWLLETRVNSAVLAHPRSFFSAVVATKSPMIPLGYEYKDVSGGIEIRRVLVDSLVPTRVELIYRPEQTSPMPGRTEPASPEPRKGTRPIPNPHDI